MPTYVNDLRLTELNTGEGSGTWGVTTNTNLELIGESLGYGTQASFASDANSTTTIADGATDPARSMYFKVTSGVSLTATRELTIAPNTVSRVMYIENATSGSQSITIKQGSGGTVTIANGNAAIVYLDGAGATAAVVDANTSLAATKVDATTLAIGGTDVTSTAAELNILDGVTSTAAELNLVDGSSAGTIVNSKAVIYGSSGEVNGTTLQIGGNSITSTAAELNLVDGSSAGTVVNSKAVIYGASGEVNATTLQIAGSSITATAAELNFLDGVTTPTGSGNLVLATSPTLTTPDIGTPSAGNLSNCTVDGTEEVGFRNIPAVGTKTASYTLATSDVGKYVQIGSGGSITIPDATFSEGDVISLFNNTTGDITITCSITTAYLGGADSDVASATLATRGVATVFFISGTVAVITGNVS